MILIILPFIVAVFYFMYQNVRNLATYEIILKWIHENNPLYDKYSYDYIYEPKENNWYGLKYPKEKHYK